MVKSIRVLLYAVFIGIASLLSQVSFATDLVAEKYPDLYLLAQAASGISDDATTVNQYVVKNNIEVIEKWIKGNEIDLEARDKHDALAIHWAAYCGHLAMLKLLLDAAPNTSEALDHGRTPLELARKGKADSNTFGVPDKGDHDEVINFLSLEKEEEEEEEDAYSTSTSSWKKLSTG